MSEETTLVVVERSTALDVFRDPAGVRAVVERVKAAALAENVHDASTPIGRAGIRTLAFKIKRSKTYIDGIGKELVDDLKELPKRIDASRKLARDELDTLHDMIRQPLTDYEAEQDRIRAAEEAAAEAKRQRAQRIADTIAAYKTAAASMIGQSAAAISVPLQVLQAATPTAADFDDRHAEALEAHGVALAQLQTMHAQASQLEAQAQAARDREIAEAAARQEREAAEARIVAAKLEAERAEQRARHAEAEADRRAEAARLAEVERQRREAQALADEAARREADVTHRKAVNNKAVEDLVRHAGLTTDQAKAVVLAVVRGQVPAVSIKY